MWDSIFLLSALASPVLLLAFAAGIAGPVIKIKVRLGLIAILVVGAAMAHILLEIISGLSPYKTDSRL